METPEQESPAPEGAGESTRPVTASEASELLPDLPPPDPEEPVEDSPGPKLPPLVSPSEPLLRRPIHVEQALVALEQIDAGDAFQLRPPGDVSALAQDLARLGQVFPVDVRLRGDRFQLVCGFRRVEALRFLRRDKVLARIHTELSDEDALLVALADAIHGQPASAEELEALRQRLAEEGRLGPAAAELIAGALGEREELAPEGPEEEIDADELASSVTGILADANQDLALLVPVFGALDEDRKAELLTQLRYAAELVAYLEES
ncbi:MAG TPA: ParB N-terminal domain-containing protein [Myxococcaceae bacterium]|nr:ParB N-terminal domain-containing protein [Myxococcaceae bacterium]